MLSAYRKYFVMGWAAYGLALVLAGQLSAQTTAFAYQGLLNDNGGPATGSYDLQFKLFDALTGGTQIGSTNSLTNVNVTNGLLKVTLDFGAAAFSGANRWLEISMRLAGGSAFTLLSPRQALTTTPYAIKSLMAASADGLSAACTNCVTSAQIGSLPTGSGNYVQNTTLQQASANFNISGNGTAGGTLSGNLVNATTQFNLGGSRVLSTGPGTGQHNFLAGLNTGNALTNGRENTFIGKETGRDTTGGLETCSGCFDFPVYEGSHNSFGGYRAGLLNAIGWGNSFFGAGTGLNNTTGNRNSFFGHVAGYSNTQGGTNAFFGTAAGYYNTEGGGNAFFGISAGISNTTGSDNSYFGANAGRGNSMGIRNVVLGAQSGFLLGFSLPSIRVGDENTFIGYLAGSSAARRNAAAIGAHSRVNCDDCMVLGNSNVTAYKVGIGTNTPTAKLDVNGGNDFARIAINSNAPTANAGLEFRLNNTKEWTIATANTQGDLIFFDESAGAGTRLQILGGTGATGGFVGIGTTVPADKLHVAGEMRVNSCVRNAAATQIAGTCPSDLRFKRSITPFPNLLDKLVKLQPVNFFWRANEFLQQHFGTEQSYGLIAQEVEAVLPELVSTDAEGFKAVNYSKLPLLLLQGMKEQQQRNEHLQQENAALRRQLQQQQTQINAILRRMVTPHHKAVLSNRR